MTRDSRETVTIELEQEVLYSLMLMAHEQDITLNQLVEGILRDYINQHPEHLHDQD